MSRAASTARIPAPDLSPIIGPCDVQAAAIDRQTAAIDRQTTVGEALLAELTATREALQPAADAMAKLGSAQEKLCDFIVKHRLKLVGYTLTALVAIGTISPVAAQKVSTLLAPFLQ